jgi:hypothetical protein
MTVPHGLLGKAYFATALLFTAIVVMIIGFGIIIAPFLVVATVLAVLLFMVMIFAVFFASI